MAPRLLQLLPLLPRVVLAAVAGFDGVAFLLGHRSFQSTLRKKQSANYPNTDCKRDALYFFESQCACRRPCLQGRTTTERYSSSSSDSPELPRTTVETGAGR